MSISGQIVSEIVAQLCSENSIQTLINFLGSTQKKFRRVLPFRELSREMASSTQIHLLALTAMISCSNYTTTTSITPDSEKSRILPFFHIDVHQILNQLFNKLWFRH